VQAVTSINVLLDKADHQYKLLQERKSALENLLVCISDHSTDTSVTTAPTQPSAGGSVTTTTSSSGSSASAINKNIQMLAQKYCSDCRNAFEELSKIIQVRAFVLVTHLIEALHDIGCESKTFGCLVKVKVKRLKGCVALYGKHIAELRSITCHVGSHSVTCHPTPDTHQAGRYSIYHYATNLYVYYYYFFFLNPQY